MKKYFLFAASALAIAGCSSDDFLGNDSSNGQNTANAVIKLGGSTTKTSRATSSPTTAYKTANLQSNGFWVYGTKHANAEDGTSNNDQAVYMNYRLEYTANSANNTQSNSAGWEYVGINNGDYLSHITPNVTGPQSIKYWDYSANSYTFYAATAKKEDVKAGNVTFKKLLEDGTAEASPYNKGYLVTLKDGAKLDELYFADRKVINKSEDAVHAKKDVYGGEVNFTFRNALTKVRVAMYETVPGYSVTIDKFYYTANNGGEQTTEATEKFTADASNTPFATSANGVAYKVVYYDNNEANGVLENQPKMLPKTTGDIGITKSTLAIGDGQNLKEGTTLKTKVNDPTFDTNGGNYTFFMPQASNDKPLSLKVDYTLTSDDGSNEVIKVKGAIAIIPAEYLRWKPNYAYTYLFKISDNTNGSTGEGGPAGLYPITFDASVVETANGNAEFISAMGTSTITTFAVKDGKFQQGNADYEANSDLYATVVDKDKKTVTLDTENAKLYELTDEALKFDNLSEELVANWIDNSKITYYKEVNAGITYENKVPTGDGKEVSLSPATATAMKVSGIAAGKYVIEYKAASAWTGAYKKIYKIVTIQQAQP